jgi:hypothetical protein
MAILDILPDSDSYTYREDSDSYYSNRLDGAAGFYSKGIKGLKEFACRWSLKTAEYILWLDFYKSRERNQDSFQIDLISENALPEPHIAKFIFNTFSIVQHSGDLVAVSCNLLAKPGILPIDTFVRLTDDGLPRITEDGIAHRILD